MAVPGELLNLDKWYLTLPIKDPSGGDPTGPWDVYQPALKTFSHPTYFRAAGGYVEYVAPAKGVTTSAASGATRSELREMKDNSGQDAKASWGFGDGKDHVLTCTLTCDPTSVVGRKEAIVGQIHDTTSGGTAVYLAVNMNSLPGTLTVFKTGPSDGVILTGLQPTTVFSYRLEVKGGSVKVYACLGADLTQLVLKKTYAATDFPDQTSGNYFKAGAYNKEPISTATSGSTIVRHYRLDLDVPSVGDDGDNGDDDDGTFDGAGTFVSTTLDEAAVFAFVLEAPLAAQALVLQGVPPVGAVGGMAMGFAGPDQTVNLLGIPRTGAVGRLSMSVASAPQTLYLTGVPPR